MLEQVKLEVVLGEGAETGGNTERFVFAVMPKSDETVPPPPEALISSRKQTQPLQIYTILSLGVIPEIAYTPSS